jgi:hypothetical protein
VATDLGCANAELCVRCRGWISCFACLGVSKADQAKSKQLSRFVFFCVFFHHALQCFPSSVSAIFFLSNLFALLNQVTGYVRRLFPECGIGCNFRDDALNYLTQEKGHLP